MQIAPLRLLASLSPAAWFGTLVSSALLCACLAYWAPQLLAPRPALAPAPRAEAALGSADLALASQLFGRRPADAPAQTQTAPINVQVLGIVAAGRLGSALLTVDGKPMRAFSVGESIGPGMRLRAVRPDHVLIDDQGRELRAPAPARTAVSVLSAGPASPRSAAAPTPGQPLSGQPAPLPAFPSPPAGAMGGAPGSQPLAPAAPSTSAAPAPIAASSAPVPGSPQPTPGLAGVMQRAPSLAPGMNIEAPR